MSQRAGDFGSILMGCKNSYNLKKYGSAEACLKAELIDLVQNPTSPVDRINYEDLAKRKQLQKELNEKLAEANKLQSVAPPRRKGISSGQLMIISACAISVLTYKYSKGNKEFKAFLGLLSPFILGYGVTQYNNYKTRKETQEYQSRGYGFNNA